MLKIKDFSKFNVVFPSLSTRYPNKKMPLVLRENGKKMPDVRCQMPDNPAHCNYYNFKQLYDLTK